MAAVSFSQSNQNACPITYLSIRENLWQKLEVEIRKHGISCKDDLKKALLMEWNKISPDYTKKLVESVPNRLKAVIRQ